ncbi:MAG: ribokinase [Maritimibacter sp.]|nr:ribokinase [Maritimibacter sp.]
MSVWNLGSINVDLFYRLPHLVQPGETLPATAHEIGLGGKGANQSVAVARAGAEVHHLGMIGADNTWVLDRLTGYGVDVAHVGRADAATGHALILVDEAGENAIVTYAGANYRQSLDAVTAALGGAAAGDIFMLQNEVSLKVESARIAQEKGLFVVYSAAPFKADVVGEMLPHVDLLVLNEVEAEQLAEALAMPVPEIPVANLIVTRGAKGASWREQATGEETRVEAFAVTPVDTAGAGDCFIGYVVAGLDQGLSRAEALRLGAAAAALKVTRPGTADAIPSRAEVDAFLAGTETK